MNKTQQIPRRVRAIGRLMAIKFIANHPSWKKGDAYEDTWYGTESHDINLYCEDGKLTVVAYKNYVDEDGQICTDTSDYAYLIKRG